MSLSRVQEILFLDTFFPVLLKFLLENFNISILIMFVTNFYTKKDFYSSSYILFVTII